MAESSKVTTGPTTADPGNQQAAQPAGQDPERDWKAEYERVLAESRKWEGRAKENRAAVKELDELKKASMTDADRLADAEKRAEAAEAKVAEYERLRERADIVAEVAAEKGVDAEWLSRMAGDTREEIEGNAGFIASKLAGSHIYPSVADGGSQGAPPITREQIDAIKDPGERVRMRAHHIDLYKFKKK